MTTKYYNIFNENDINWQSLFKDKNNEVIAGDQQHVKKYQLKRMYEDAFPSCNGCTMNLDELVSLYLECVRRDIADGSKDNEDVLYYLRNGGGTRDNFRNYIYIYNEKFVNIMFNNFTNFKKSLIAYTLMTFCEEVAKEQKIDFKICV